MRKLSGLWAEGETLMSEEAKFVVRPAGSDDLEAIVSLWHQLLVEHEARDRGYWALVPEEEARARYREGKAKMLDDPERLHVVAEVEGVVVGFVHALRLERPPLFKLSRVARIDEVAVDIKHRRRGAGRAMMSMMLRLLKERGYEYTDLMVDYNNEGAQALYRGLGYFPRELHLVKKL